MINNEGYYNGLIQSIDPIKNRFGKSGFELECKVGVFAEDGKTPLSVEEIYLEISDAYGQPPMNDRTQKQISLESLKACGWQYGEDLSKLPTLVGAKCRIRAKKDSKGNMRCYFTSHREVEKISIEEAMKMMSAIGNPSASASPFGAPAAAAPAPAAAAPSGIVPNPFAGM